MHFYVLVCYLPLFFFFEEKDKRKWLGMLALFMHSTMEAGPFYTLGN